MVLCLVGLIARVIFFMTTLDAAALCLLLLTAELLGRRPLWLSLGQPLPEVRLTRGCRKALQRGPCLLRRQLGGLGFLLPGIPRSTSRKLDPEYFFGYFKFIVWFLDASSPDICLVEARVTFILLLLYSFGEVLEGALRQVEARPHYV